MPKKGLLNSKGRPAGSGCVSNKRREEFKKKGMERELKNMKLEDEGASKVDWEEDKRVGNRKVRKLTAGDIAEMLKPKPKDETHAKEVEKPCGKEKVEEVEKKMKRRWGSTSLIHLLTKEVVKVPLTKGMCLLPKWSLRRSLGLLPQWPPRRSLSLLPKWPLRRSLGLLPKCLSRRSLGQAPSKSKWKKNKKRPRE